MTTATKKRLLVQTYYASKLAKQYPEHENACYEVKEELLRRLIDYGLVTLKGFHQIGEYTRTTNRDMGWSTTSRFYADYYETPDGEWGFHTPRSNGRGKGNLGYLADLSQNSDAEKLKTEEEVKIASANPKIKKILRKIQEEKEEKERKNEELVNQLVASGDTYKDVIYGPYSNDWATFTYEIISKKEATIKLTELVSDYSWARRYNKPTHDVGDIVTIAE